MSRLTLLIAILLPSLLPTGALEVTLVIDEFSENAERFIRPYLDTDGASWIKNSSHNLYIRDLTDCEGLFEFRESDETKYCYKQGSLPYGANITMLVGAELTLSIFRSDSWESVALTATCRSGRVEAKKWQYWNSYDIYQDDVCWKDLPWSRRWIYKIRCPSAEATTTHPSTTQKPIRGITEHLRTIMRATTRHMEQTTSSLMNQSVSTNFIGNERTTLNQTSKERTTVTWSSTAAKADLSITTGPTTSGEMIIMYGLVSVGVVLIIVIAAVLIRIRSRRRSVSRIFQRKRQNPTQQVCFNQPASALVTNGYENQQMAQETDSVTQPIYMEPTVQITSPNNNPIIQSFHPDRQLTDKDGYTIMRH